MSETSRPRRRLPVGVLPTDLARSVYPEYVVISDLRYHDFTFHAGVRSIKFTAGNAGGAKLKVDSWQSGEVVLSMPRQDGDRSQMQLHAGDPIYISVTNPTTNLVTTRGGKVPVELDNSGGWKAAAMAPPVAVGDSEIKSTTE